VSEEIRDAQWRLHQWFGDSLTEQQFHDLRLFHVELIRFSDKINLVSINTLYISDQMHFADSVYGSRFVLEDLNSNEIVDIGSGNGFPGLVLAILNRDVNVIFVETRGKKVEFIKHVCSRLGLENVKVLHTRIEDLPAQSVKAAISRGFAPLPKALLTTRGIFDSGGTYYHMKSDGWASEVGSMPPQLIRMWNVEHLGDYAIPDSDLTRTVIKATKKE